MEDLGWNRLGLNASEMMAVMEDCEVCRLNLKLLAPTTLTENRAMKERVLFHTAGDRKSTLQTCFPLNKILCFPLNGIFLPNFKIIAVTTLLSLTI